MAKKINGDFEITRNPPVHPYILNPEEVKKQDAFFAARGIPGLLAQGIEEYITRKTGKPWDDLVTIERLRRAVVAQKDDYWKPAHKRSLRYTKAYSVIGYLAYHFPVYVMQTEYLLMMLAREGLLKKTMTILDVGTGPGLSRSPLQISIPGLKTPAQPSGPWRDQKNTSRRSRTSGMPLSPGEEGFPSNLPLKPIL